MKERIRSFIAVELEPPIRRALAQEVSRLARCGAEVKWVAEGSLHITLKFLGDVARASLGELTEAIGEVARQASPFAIELGGVSFFPKPVRPRVIAAGIDAAGTEALASLAGRLEERVGALGFRREERAFRGHVTLGRVRTPRGLGGLSDAVLTASGEPFGRQEVGEIVLFMSELSRSGPTYTVLGRCRLGGVADG